MTYFAEVCESRFDKESPEDRGYSIGMSAYKYVPEAERLGIRDHMLFMRKDLRSQMFQVCREYPSYNPINWFQPNQPRPPSVIEIIFQGTFNSAISVLNEGILRFWGKEYPPNQCSLYTPCSHRGRNRDCRKRVTLPSSDKVNDSRDSCRFPTIPAAPIEVPEPNLEQEKLLTGLNEGKIVVDRGTTLLHLAVREPYSQRQPVIERAIAKRFKK